MIEFPQDPTLILIARFVLAAIFLLGAIQKFSSLDRFFGVVRNYEILPEGPSKLFALALPAAELIAALALITGLRLGPALSALLILLVTAGVAVNLLRGRTDIDCGCGGGAEQPLSWMLVARNVVLIAVCAYASAPAAHRPLEATDFAVTGLAALVGLGLYIALNQAAANWSRMQAHRH